MARTVEDAALTLDAVAGRDGLDPRQPHDLEVQDYSGALGTDISDMTVAVLQEGFEHEAGDEEINEVVRDAVADLDAAGAEVTEVSIPEHMEAGALNTTIGRYGSAQVLLQNAGPSGFDGWYNTGAMEYLGRAVEARANDLPSPVKAGLLVGEYLREEYGGAVYGKAQNRKLEVRETYSEVLEDIDALVMPTVAVKNPAYGEARGMENMLDGGIGTDLSLNTSPFNSTHHPALTVPCGEAGDTPVGMMLVGERFDDATLLKLGYAYEQYTS